jgi:hemerythrin superfamily protein
MSILDIIKKDHKTVSFLFTRLSETNNRAAKKRSELFDVLKEELEIHTHMEEAVFYPALKEDAADLIQESLREHSIVEDLLRELEIRPKNTSEWMYKLAELRINVEHHINEEEQEIFQLARKILDENELDQLGKAAQVDRAELFALK